MTARVPGRTEAVYDYVVRVYHESGTPPTAREIAAGIDAPVSTIWHHLQSLTKQGRLRRVRRKYVPLAVTPESVGIRRPVASCPWGETAHRYIEARVAPVLFCEKCGGTLGIDYDPPRPLEFVS